jgi:excinuclease ABC subunit A
MEVLHELADAGNTIGVIEHNLEVIKTAYWIIDTGPQGGDGGGRIIAAGAPQTIAATKEDYTGQYLRPARVSREGQAAGCGVVRVQAAH